MNNALIVMACFTWMFASSAGLQQLSDALGDTNIHGQNISIPTAFPTSDTATTNVTCTTFDAFAVLGGDHAQTCAIRFLQTFADCVITLIAFCDPNVDHARSSLFQIITNVIAFSYAAFQFLFQMARGQIPYFTPALLLVVIGPPAAALAYIAFTALRGNATS